MWGYNYLMSLVHMINVLVQYSERLVKMFNTLGIREFIRFVRQTIGAPWLDPVWACYNACLEDPQQLIFICDHLHSENLFGCMTYTYFKDDFRRRVQRFRAQDCTNILKHFAAELNVTMDLQKKTSIIWK